VCDVRWLDPVASATDRREVKVVGWIDRDLVSADRPAEDDAQRIEDVCDGRGGEALLAQVVDEAWTSRRWICDSFQAPRAGTTYERSSCS
jgi:hypothetical protein